MRKLNKLKFSHDYEKLPKYWEDTIALLLGVARIADMDSLKLCIPQLIKTDTMFRGEEGHYSLDFKEGIILSFFHLNSNTLFTTIRRYTPEKFKYYKLNTGEIFEMKRVND